MRFSTRGFPVLANAGAGAHYDCTGGIEPPLLVIYFLSRGRGVRRLWISYPHSSTLDSVDPIMLWA